MGGIWSAFVGFLEQALLWFSTIGGSAGIGIILFTIAARLAILPLTLSSLRSSRKMQQIQPLVKELQRKYGKEPQKLQEETMRLYREHKINPVGGCLPMLLQLPIFFGVYQAVYHLFGPEEQRQNLSAAAAQALQDPNVAALFNTPFLGLIDLGRATFGSGMPFEPIYLVLPVMSVFFQLIQTVMATPRVQDPQQKAITQAMMIMPIVFGYIAFTFPQGAVLYWVMSSVVGVIQQYFTSGWGSLANYLKFLPPDGKPTTLPALAPVASSDEPATEGTAAATAAPRTDFWTVMRPLTETAGTTDTSATSADPAVEQAIEAARTQNRQASNARRPRKRK
jgi:YidC/Oxa1 family membrane protein insertase